jgi:hypothetical protein
VFAKERLERRGTRGKNQKKKSERKRKKKQFLYDERLPALLFSAKVGSKLPACDEKHYSRDKNDCQFFPS